MHSQVGLQNDKMVKPYKRFQSQGQYKSGQPL